MTDKDLTPRILAGLALGEDPSKFMSFRIMPDQSVVIVDPVGRKFILTRPDLERVADQVIAQRLHARGRAMVQDLKASAQGYAGKPMVTKVASEAKRSPGGKPSPVRRTTATKPGPDDTGGATKSGGAPKAKPVGATKSSGAPKAKPGSATKSSGAPKPKPADKPKPNGKPPSVPPDRGEGSGA